MEKAAVGRPVGHRNRDVGDRDIAEHETRLPNRPSDADPANADPVSAVRSAVDDDLAGGFEPATQAHPHTV